jgi:hypothetical protein
MQPLCTGNGHKEQRGTAAVSRGKRMRIERAVGVR